MCNRPTTIETRLFINGEFYTPASNLTLPIHTPFDSTPIASVSLATLPEVNLAVSAAAAAFPAWSSLGPAGRKPFLTRLATLLRAHKHEIALLEALNLGRALPITEGEVEFNVEILEYFANAAGDVGGEMTRMPGEGMLGLELCQPFGVVACILPWNLPTGQFVWKAGAALAVGNTVVVKSSERAPLTALKIAELVKEAGFPPGVVNFLSGDGPTCGAHLAGHPDIGRLSFTGSTATGRCLQTIAATTNLKSLSLEMGGKSPCIVFGDADLSAAAKKAAFSGGWLAGQTCFSNSRILVDESVAEDFIHLFREAFCVHSREGAEVLLEDPTVDGADGLTPLVDQKQLDKVLGYILEGAKTCPPLAGGYRIGSKGFFVAPTIFYNLPATSTLLKDEIFGPVVCINTFANESEAIAMANDTVYGLHASVFTKDIDRAIRVAKALQTGMVTVNSSTPDLAQGMKFGGWKNSQSGSRDGWMSGLRGMVQTKSVNIRFAA